MTTATNERKQPIEIAFKGGRLLMTRAVAGLVARGFNPAEILQRHFLGDDGDVCPYDHKANQEAIKAGERVMSSYDTPAGTIWIITEADRSATTLLLPEDY